MHGIARQQSSASIFWPSERSEGASGYPIPARTDRANESVAVLARHPYIAQQDVRGVGRQLFPGSRSGLCCEHSGARRRQQKSCTLQRRELVVHE